MRRKVFAWSRSLCLPGSSDSGSFNSRAPLRQLRPPETVSVTLQERRPKMFFFREKRYTVEHAYGPWLTGRLVEPDAMGTGAMGFGSAGAGRLRAVLLPGA